MPGRFVCATPFTDFPLWVKMYWILLYLLQKEGKLEDRSQKKDNVFA